MALLVETRPEARAGDERANSGLLTAADLLRMHSEGSRGELIQGVFYETMAAGQRHGKLVARLVARLVVHAEASHLGTVVASDSGVLLERDPDTVREPDIAFTSAERLPLGEDLDTYAEVVPDLVVEVASPSDRHGKLVEKVRMWLSHGVRLVWVVRPADRAVEVHQAGLPPVTLREGAALDGADVLAGFKCPLAELFAA